MPHIITLCDLHVETDLDQTASTGIVCNAAHLLERLLREGSAVAKPSFTKAGLWAESDYAPLKPELPLC